MVIHGLKMEAAMKSQPGHVDEDDDDDDDEGEESDGDGSDRYGMVSCWSVCKCIAYDTLNL